MNPTSGSKVLTDIRNNNRVFHKSEELAQTLWEKLQPFAPVQPGNSHAIRPNDNYRKTRKRYPVGIAIRKTTGQYG